MITVAINNSKRSNNEITPRWIQHEVNSSRKAGLSACLKVTIKKQDIDLHFVSKTCRVGGGGGVSRPFTPNELYLIDKWRKIGFEEMDVNAGMVVHFMGEINRICN